MATTKKYVINAIYADKKIGAIATVPFYQVNMLVKNVKMGNGQKVRLRKKLKIF